MKLPRKSSTNEKEREVAVMGNLARSLNPNNFSFITVSIAFEGVESTKRRSGSVVNK